MHDVTNATASQLTGYRTLSGEDEKVAEMPRRSSLSQHTADRENNHSEGVRFSPSTKDLVNETGRDGEVLVEHVEYSPAFDVHQSKDDQKERLYESVERRQNGNTSPSSNNGAADRCNDSSDSSSASVRSYTLEHTDSKSSDSDTKDLGFEDVSMKTPSPSPAVVPSSYQPEPIQRSTPPTVAPRVVPSPMTQPEAPAVTPTSTVTSGPRSANNFDGLALGMSAQEMREMLQKKRRPDPRTQRIDMMLKHELVNKM